MFSQKTFTVQLTNNWIVFVLQMYMMERIMPVYDQIGWNFDEKEPITRQ